MGHYDVIQTYKDMRSGKKKLYVTTAASDVLDKKNVSSDNIYFEEEITDQTNDIVNSIEYYIDSIIREDYVNGYNFDEFYIKFIPLLFYRLDTIKEEFVADNDSLDWNTEYVKLMISFVTIKDGKETYKFGNNPLVATVNYNNFVNNISNKGYNINYRNLFDLSRDILKLGKEEEKFPDLYMCIFDKEDTKRYQEEAENYKQKSL